MEVTIVYYTGWDTVRVSRNLYERLAAAVYIAHETSTMHVD